MPACDSRCWVVVVDCRILEGPLMKGEGSASKLSLHEICCDFYAAAAYGTRGLKDPGTDMEE